MSTTVLTFLDFFWIWLVVTIANGSSTYLQKADSNADDLKEMKQQLAILTEEVRHLSRGNGRTGQ